MRHIVSEKTYYSWCEIMETPDKQSAENFETALYAIKIPARMKAVGESYFITVPYPYEETAREAAKAFEKGIFEYPSELFTKKEIPTMNRFVPVKHHARASRPFLILGLVFFFIFLVKVLFSFM